MHPLRRRLLDELIRRNYAPRTIHHYVVSVAAYARYFGRSPDRLGADDIRRYQVHLRDERGLSFSTCNVIACALRFFYRHVHPIDDPVATIPFARKERRLCRILSQDEVQALRAAAWEGRDRLLIELLYGCGLRVSEVVGLEVGDIDCSRRMIHVRCGKGRRDRLVPLPSALIDHLARWCRGRRLAPRDPLFPRAVGPGAIETRVVQRVVTTTARAAGITKRVTPHILRHSYATHLIEAGVDIRVVQSCLGHGSILTTLRYHHVARQVVTATCSPLDLLGTEPTPTSRRLALPSPGTPTRHPGGDRRLSQIALPGLDSGS